MPVILSNCLRVRGRNQAWKSMLASENAWLSREWQPSVLPESLLSMLSDGIVRQGSTWRLRKALQQARSGAPFVLAGVGASITADFGGVIGFMQDQFDVGLIGKAARYDRSVRSLAAAPHLHM